MLIGDELVHGGWPCHKAMILNFLGDAGGFPYEERRLQHPRLLELLML